MLNIIYKDWVDTWENQVISAASGSTFPLQCSHMPKAQAA